MTFDRYSLGANRELRVTRARGLVFLSIHHAEQCVTGPLAVPDGAALDTLRSALADVAGETGSSAATHAERPATREPRSERRTP